jgi:hypothetical protein
MLVCYFLFFTYDEKILHLTNIARINIESSKNPSIIMFCGPTRVGKSETASRLISGINGIKGNVFKSQGGLEPCTMEFLCFGPVNSKLFAEKFGIEVNDPKEEYDIFFVDTEGLNAILDQTKWVKYGLICLLHNKQIIIFN